MDTIHFIHEGLSRTIWMFFLAVGIWGAVRAILGFGLNGSYLGALAIGELLFILQALLGALLWFNVGTAGVARPGIHLLYGLFALLFLPFIYFSVLKGDETNRGQWVMSFCALFLFGIALRAITTAQEPLAALGQGFF